MARTSLLFEMQAAELTGDLSNLPAEVARRLQGVRERGQPHMPPRMLRFDGEESTLRPSSKSAASAVSTLERPHRDALTGYSPVREPHAGELPPRVEVRADDLLPSNSPSLLVSTTAADGESEEGINPTSGSSKNSPASEPMPENATARALLQPHNGQSRPFSKDGGDE